MGVWTPGPGPTEGDDTFTGDNTDETATGLGGNDAIYGNGGADTLDGGNGDDTLHANLFDTLIGGDGTDTVAFDFGAFAVQLDLSGVTFSGGVFSGTMHMFDYVANQSSDTAISGVEIITVTGQNLTFVGSNGAELATGVANGQGNGGDDVLVGDADHSLLVGGDGDDQLTGGAGSDTFVYARGPATTPSSISTPGPSAVRTSLMSRRSASMRAISPPALPSSTPAPTRSSASTTPISSP